MVSILSTISFAALALGFLVSLAAAGVMLLVVSLLGSGRSLQALSYIVAVVVLVLLVLPNSLFFGLIGVREGLEVYREQIEHPEASSLQNLVQMGTDVLQDFLPGVAEEVQPYTDKANELLQANRDEEIRKVDNHLRRVKRYIWVDAIVITVMWLRGCLIIFATLRTAGARTTSRSARVARDSRERSRRAHR